MLSDSRGVPIICILFLDFARFVIVLITYFCVFESFEQEEVSSNVHKLLIKLETAQVKA